MDNDKKRLQSLCEEAQEVINPSYEREKEISRQINKKIVDDKEIKTGVQKVFAAAFSNYTGMVENATGNDKATVAEKVVSQIYAAAGEARKRAGASNW